MLTRSSKVSVLDDVGDPDAPPGSLPWAKWFLGQAQLRRTKLDDDATGLRVILDKLEKHAAWKTLGFGSLGQLCRDALSLDEHATQLLRSAKPGTTLRAIEYALNAKPTGERGKRNSESSNLSRGGNDRIVAQIAKRSPDVLERMKAGEFKSVRAAGIEAGIVKVPTKYEAAQKVAKKLSVAEKRRLIKWLEKNIGKE